APHEDPRIPGIVARAQKRLGALARWFLRETLQPDHARSDFSVELQISVTSVGLSRFNADGHEMVIRLCECKRMFDHAGEFVLVADEMIRRQHGDHAFALPLLDFKAAERDCRAGVATCGLSKKIHTAELLETLRRVLLVGRDVDRL